MKHTNKIILRGTELLSRKRHEDLFRDRLIADLRKREINAVNLRGGTFDMIIEGRCPFVFEIKRMQDKIRGVYDKGNWGFRFTKDQTEEISNMDFPPFVIAFKKNEFYLFPPDWIWKEVAERLDHGTAVISIKCCDFPEPISYVELIDQILEKVGHVD